MISCDVEILKSINKLVLPEYGYIDIHCHHFARDDVLQIFNKEIQDFSHEIDESFCSLGLHPWFIDGESYGRVLENISAFANQSNVLAIGECGLDKAIKTPLNLQIAVFKQQLKLAENLNKPVIIHCVRAFNELMAIKKQINRPKYWIVHGFNAKPILADQLLKLDFHLSLGKALLYQDSNAAKTLAVMPLNRLFLETDASQATIEQIYEAACGILGMEIADLQTLIAENFRQVFMD